MGYVARPAGTALGVYRFLADAEKAGHRRWEEGQQRRLKNGYALEEYPRQRRLEAFSAQQPVNVPTGEIWGWNAVNAGAPHVPRPPGRLAGRAIVRPDDTITFTNENWVALYIEEHGL
jgi:hypothetical protein